MLPTAGRSHPRTARYDLGLIEFLFLIVLAVTFRILDRHPRPVGFFFGLYGVVYGSFRIWLDTLHLQPMRFYGGAVAVIVGLLAWASMWVYWAPPAREENSALRRNLTKCPIGAQLSV